VTAVQTLTVDDVVWSKWLSRDNSAADYPILLKCGRDDALWASWLTKGRLAGQASSSGNAN